MSSMSVLHTMDRIKSATPSSPIAVFRGKVRGEVNAVFAATVRTRQLIEAGDPDLIGVYDGSMNMSEIAETLRRAIF